MSTEYKIASGVELHEASCKVRFFLSPSREELDADQLRAAIIRQIEVLSYISDEPEMELQRFNVTYGQTR